MFNVHIAHEIPSSSSVLAREVSNLLKGIFQVLEPRLLNDVQYGLTSS